MNETENTSFPDEAEEIAKEEEGKPEEAFTCEDNDTVCKVTKLLLAVAIVCLVVLAIAVYWD